MPVIQISEIQVRHGLEIDMPGKPTSITPLEFSPGLKVGELAFTTDTGRVFIGHNPEPGNPNYNRVTFPYQQIEVLTENSLEALQRFFAGFTRNVGKDAFFRAILAPTPDADEWADVLITLPDNSTSAVTFTQVDRLSVRMEYQAFSSDYRPLRNGFLSLWYDGEVSEPMICDDATGYRRTDLSAVSGSLDPEAVAGFLSFKGVEIAAGGQHYVQLRYRNTLPANIYLFLNFTRVTP